MIISVINAVISEGNNHYTGVSCSQT